MLVGQGREAGKAEKNVVRELRKRKKGRDGKERERKKKRKERRKERRGGEKNVVGKRQKGKEKE